MRWYSFFGDYQPLDGRVAFIYREALKDNPRFEYKRVYCLEDDGIFTIVLDKEKNNIYSVEVKKKKKPLKGEPIKDSVKEEIINIFVNWCAQHNAFNEKEFSTIQTFSKGIMIKDDIDGLYAIDIVKKARMPK